jgi:hypothetical protein
MAAGWSHRFGDAITPRALRDLMLRGSPSWTDFERKVWRLAIAASAVWIAYVVIFDILFFRAEPYERSESGVFVSGQFDTFDDFAGAIGRGPSSGDISRMEGIRTRNLERQARNEERKRRNDGYVWLGLQKAFVYPFTVLAALLSFIEIYEMLQRDRAKKHEEVIDAVKSNPAVEFNMGDVYKYISNSSIINRSALKDSLQVTQARNPDVSASLVEIVKIVSKSNNKDADDHLNMLTSELAKPQPNKSVLKTIWVGLKELLPVLKDATEVAKSVDEYIAS